MKEEHKDILITTIIPCYNCSQYIEETIDSVVNQTHKRIEIICVDNNSTDNTWNLLLDLQKKHACIQVFSEKRKGANYARNLGLKNANGKFLQFLDSDDIIDKYKFEKQSAFLIENNLDVVVSDRKILDSELKEVIEILEFRNIKKNLLETAIAQIIITGNPLYTTQIVKDIGGYQDDLEVAQDWEFHIRLFLATSNIGYLPGYFLLSRKTKNSLSSDTIKVSNAACKVIKKFKPQLLEKKVFQNDNIMQKIIFVYIESFLNGNSQTKKEYKKELIFWHSISANKNIITGKMSLLNTVLGFKSFLRIKNLVHQLKAF